VFREFAYLKQKHNARLIYGPTYLNIDHTNFTAIEGRDKLHGGNKEAIRSNAPKPRGMSVVLRVLVDSVHSGDQLT
jgi:hypothetical protein